MKENELKKCPKCGSDVGLVANGTFAQYYDWSGEPCGFTHNSVANTVRCVRCGYKTDIRKVRADNEQRETD